MARRAFLALPLGLAACATPVQQGFALYVSDATLCNAPPEQQEQADLFSLPRDGLTGRSHDCLFDVPQGFEPGTVTEVSGTCVDAVGGADGALLVRVSPDASVVEVTGDIVPAGPTRFEACP